MLHAPLTRPYELHVAVAFIWSRVLVCTGYGNRVRLLGSMFLFLVLAISICLCPPRLWTLAARRVAGAPVLSCLLALYTAVMSFEILFPFGLWVFEPGWLLN